MVGRNGTTETRCVPVDRGTQNSKPLPRRFSNPSSTYHVDRIGWTGSRIQSRYHRLDVDLEHRGRHRTVPKTSRRGDLISQQRSPRKRYVIGFLDRIAECKGDSMPEPPGKSCMTYFTTEKLWDMIYYSQLAFVTVKETGLVTGRIHQVSFTKANLQVSFTEVSLHC